MIRGLYETHLQVSNLQRAISFYPREIQSKAVFGRDGSEPIVHAGDPAGSIYFDDPDENELELYTRLPGEPRNLDFTPLLSEWNN